MTISQRLTKPKVDTKAAISRKLSPLERTAAVAGFKSTHTIGEIPNPNALYEELLSAESEKG